MDLQLTITRTERSKDSYSIIEMWRITNNDISLQKSYSGRLSGRKPQSQKNAISEEEIKTIHTFLENNNLLKNVLSPKYNQFHVPYNATHVTLKISQSPGEFFLLDLYNLTKQINKNPDFKKINSLKRILKQYLTK
ncbi:MAG: hypothetical protein AAF518_24680 [Spirochaetota bacterium]